MKLRWIYALLVLLYACGGNDNAATTENKEDLGIKSVQQKLDENLAMIAEARKLIHDGDLIMRTGTDFSSQQVRLFSQKDQTYSHGGIAFRDSGDIYVYHVVPDYYHVVDKVKKEKLDSFCNPKQNTGIGIARYNIDSTELRSFRSYLEKQVAADIPFDMRFDMHTDDSLYCSEMIHKGLKLATNGRITIEIEKFRDRSKYKLAKQHLKLTEKELHEREFIPIDHLFLHPQCQFIKRFSFEQ